LAFVRFSQTSPTTFTSQIGVVDADGANLRVLTDTMWEIDGADFSPDGSRIVFAGGANLTHPDSATSANRPFGLWLINADGTGLTRLVAPPNPIFPHWSPDGSRIILEATLHDDIWIENADGTSQRQLTNTADTDIDPVMSPDGSMIAFTRSNGGQSQWALFAMNSDGSNVRQLTTYATYNHSATWAADGKRLVFGHVGVDGTYLAVVNADGSGFAPYSPRVNDAIFSEFRPDGKAIAYSAPIFTGAGLVVLDPATGSHTSVTPTGTTFSDVSPSWGRTKAGAR
jgi:TolB protein